MPLHPLTIAAPYSRRTLLFAPCLRKETIRNVLTAAQCAALVMFLVGCGANGPQPTNTVQSVELALTAAEKAATIYVKLPVCPQSGGLLCSDVAVSAKIKAADSIAYQGVVDMRAGKVTPEAVTALITQFVALIPASK